jgi:two-component system NarL family sensor kinase
VKSTRRKRSSRHARSRELARLRARLADAEQTLRAIRTGEVDAVVIAGGAGPQVFTLQGAERPYRVLIEAMNEGALTLTEGKTILYANQCFSKMVNCPLEKVIGGSLRRFLSIEDRVKLRAHLKRIKESGSKILVMLIAVGGSKMPVQISIRPLARNGLDVASFGMVVTDISESLRTEKLLQALTHRGMQMQEAERGSVAIELHDNITQLLCAILVRCQALAGNLSALDRASEKEAMKIREMLGETAGEVQRISRNLRPSVLDELGLGAVLRDTSTEFTERTGVPVKLTCMQLTTRLPADTELTLYRILQEALKNVEKHARARHVTVRLWRRGAFVQLAIDDDGIGFDPDQRRNGRIPGAALGLLGMRERASIVSGVFTVKSAPRLGTRIEVRIPQTPPVTVAD